MGLLHVQLHPYCENQHYIAVACDAREVTPPIEYTDCKFCELGTEENDIPFSQTQKYWETSKYEKIDITESNQILTPLTLQMIRYIANTDNREACLNAIGRLLFPFIVEDKRKMKAQEFVSICFTEYQKLNQRIEKITSIEDYQYAFNTAMDIVMPNVWNQICSKMYSLGPQFIFAPTLENLLTQFLININYRLKAPVIYAFLRLQSRFNGINDLYSIYSFINKRDEMNDKEIKDTEKIFKRVISILQHSYIPENLHDSLEEIHNNDIKEYLDSDFTEPTKDYDTFVFYAITNYLSEAHNEFIHILEKSIDIHPKVVFDTDDDLIDNYLIPKDRFAQLLFHSLVGRIDKHGNISDIEKVEKQFIGSIKPFEFTYILPSKVSLGSSVTAQIPVQTLPKIYSTKIPSIPISINQKSKINKYIIKINNTTGFKLLLEHIMNFVISMTEQIKDSSLEKLINSMIEKINEDKEGKDRITFMESAAYSAFKNAITKSKENFTISHVVPLYNFVSNPSIQLQYKNTDFNIYHKVYKDFKTHFNLNVIPNSSITEKNVNTDTMLNVIVKLMCYLIKENPKQEKIRETMATFESKLNSEEEKADLKTLIDIIEKPAFLLTAFKLLFNSIF